MSGNLPLDKVGAPYNTLQYLWIKLGAADSFETTFFSLGESTSIYKCGKIVNLEKFDCLSADQ